MIGERIKQRLAELKKTQYWLAKKIGIDNASVYRYCNNKTVPNAYLFCDIADALGVSTDWLLGRTK